MTPLGELVQLIEKVSGVVVPEHDRGSLERLALERSRQCGVDGLEPYVTVLRSNLEGGEWQALLSRITVKESYLFRAPQQLRAVADDVLPRLLAGRTAGGSLRVWSAGCARGEEPTTLAMVMAESRHLVGHDWRILATDVDESALDEARRAVFGRRAVACVPAPLLERHMVAKGGGRYALVDRLRARIHYKVLNLVSRPLLLPEAPFELVFLRNVLIYFRPEQQRRVVAAVVEAMAPDGYLFLGPAESLWHLDSGLVPVDLGDCFGYRLPGAVRDQPEPLVGRVGPSLVSAPTEEERAGEGSGVGAFPRQVTEGRREAVTRSSPRPELGPILTALGQGLLQPARALILEAVRRFPDNAHLRALEGLVAEVESDQGRAIRCYRAALYLDPRLYQVRFLLARCLELTGWEDPAQRAYREALTMAEQGSTADEIPGGIRAGIPSTKHVIAGCRRALEGPSTGRRR